MHEFALYGVVSKDNRDRTLQQLAGLTRMQPLSVEEIRLVFKAKSPAGLGALPSGGGSQGIGQQDLQKVKTMLNASLYYVQLVGQITRAPNHIPYDGDIEMTDLDVDKESRLLKIHWSFEFRDTPDPGKQSVSSRLISKTVLQDGNPAAFLGKFGYEYVARYFVRGHKFYDRDTTLFLHEILRLPLAPTIEEAIDFSFFGDSIAFEAVDPAQQLLLQLSIDVVDGNHPELKDKATRQLLSLKQTLRSAVELGPGERLALDTKVPTTSRRL